MWGNLLLLFGPQLVLIVLDLFDVLGDISIHFGIILLGLRLTVLFVLLLELNHLGRGHMLHNCSVLGRVRLLGVLSHFSLPLLK